MKRDPRHESRADRLRREAQEAAEMNQALLAHAGSLDRELLANSVDPTDEDAVAAFLLN